MKKNQIARLARIEARLRTHPSSASEIAVWMNACLDTGKQWMRWLYEEKKIYIFEYRLHKTIYARIYAWGKKPDAVLVKLTPQEHAQRAYANVRANPARLQRRLTLKAVQKRKARNGLRDPLVSALFGAPGK